MNIIYSQEAEDKDILIEMLRTQITQIKSGHPQLKYHTIGQTSTSPG